MRKRRSRSVRTLLQEIKRKDEEISDMARQINEFGLVCDSLRGEIKSKEELVKSANNFLAERAPLIAALDVLLEREAKAASLLSEDQLEAAKMCGVEPADYAIGFLDMMKKWHQLSGNDKYYPPSTKLDR